MYAKMHFCIKCIFAQLNIFLWKMYAKMHFGIKCICNILLVLNIFLWKMYALQKCIFASNAFLQRKANQNVRKRQNAFDAYILFAEHFPLENVRQNAFWHQMLFCTNKMLQMHLMPKCCVFCFAKNKDAVQKCIFASHFVLQKCIFASTKCYKCI